MFQRTSLYCPQFLKQRKEMLMTEIWNRRDLLDKKLQIAAYTNNIGIYDKIDCTTQIAIEKKIQKKSICQFVCSFARRQLHNTN